MPLPFLNEHGFDLEPIHYQIQDPCFKHILKLVYSTPMEIPQAKL